MNNQNYPPNEIVGMLLAEMTAIRTALQKFKEEPLITHDWIPRQQVMAFFGYGDTQMGTLEKSGDLVMTKVGNRKFYHRQSILQLLQNNIHSA
jgi:hypothetical protein